MEHKLSASVWVILTEDEFRDMDRKRRNWLQYLRDHWQVVCTFRCFILGKDMTVWLYRRDPGSK